MVWSLGLLTLTLLRLASLDPVEHRWILGRVSETGVVYLAEPLGYDHFHDHGLLDHFHDHGLLVIRVVFELLPVYIQGEQDNEGARRFINAEFLQLAPGSQISDNIYFLGVEVIYFEPGYFSNFFGHLRTDYHVSYFKNIQAYVKSRKLEQSEEHIESLGTQSQLLLQYWVRP